MQLPTAHWCLPTELTFSNLNKDQLVSSSIMKDLRKIFSSGELSTPEHLRRFWDPNKLDCQSRRLRSRIVSRWTSINYFLFVLLHHTSAAVLLHLTCQTETSFVNVITTTAKCCIVSGTAVVSYKTALRVLYHGELHEQQRQLHQCIEGLNKFYTRNSKLKKGSKDEAVQKKWCSVHKTTRQDDAECNAQGASRPSENDNAQDASSAAVRSAGSPAANDNEKPSLNFNDALGKRLAFSGLVAGSDGMGFHPTVDRITMIVGQRRVGSLGGRRGDSKTAGQHEGFT